MAQRIRLQPTLALVAALILAPLGTGIAWAQTGAPAASGAAAPVSDPPPADGAPAEEAPAEEAPAEDTSAEEAPAEQGMPVEEESPDDTPVQGMPEDVEEVVVEPPPPPSLFETVVELDPAAFFWMTVVMFGFAAWMSGRAVAQTWRPGWQVVPYAFLLACADRFLAWALFGAPLLAPVGFAIGWALLAAIALVAWRLASVRLQLRQYPWLFERSGVFSLRRRPAE